jgi:hypothetical protein
VLYLTGGKDFFFPENVAELSTFKNIKPNFHCIYDTGHNMLVTRVAECAAVIASFIVKHSK